MDSLEHTGNLISGIMINVAWQLPIYLVLLCVKFVHSSDGEMDDKYNSCMDACLRNSKDANIKLDFHLRLFGWNPQDDCRYNCMFIHTQERMENGLHILKYYGKWPLVRLLGIQEPALVLFSLLNIWGHLAGWNNYKRVVPTDHEFYHSTCYHFWISVSGWTGAVIYHTRNLYWTECLDSIGSTIIIAISVFSCLCRLSGKVNNLGMTLIGGLLITILFAQHIYYINFIKFDYSYNNKFMMSARICNIIVWLIWCAEEWTRRIYTCYFMSTVLIVLYFVGIVLGDFKPLFWVLNAQCLWYLGTAYIGYLWYQCMINDWLSELW